MIKWKIIFIMVIFPKEITNINFDYCNKNIGKLTIKMKCIRAEWSFFYRFLVRIYLGNVSGQRVSLINKLKINKKRKKNKEFI